MDLTELPKEYQLDSYKEVLALKNDTEYQNYKLRYCSIMGLSSKDCGYAKEQSLSEFKKTYKDLNDAYVTSYNEHINEILLTINEFNTKINNSSLSETDKQKFKTLFYKLQKMISTEAEKTLPLSGTLIANERRKEIQNYFIAATAALDNKFQNIDEVDFDKFYLINIAYIEAQVKLYDEYLSYVLDNSTLPAWASENANINDYIGNLISSIKIPSKNEIYLSSNIIGSTYLSVLASSNDLNKRMGELRDDAKSSGAWARLSYTRYNVYDNNFNSVYLQAGYDKLNSTSNADNFLGFMINYSKISDFDGYLGVGAYYSSLLNNGLFYDLSAKANFNFTSDNKQALLSFIAELGYRYDINNYYIEPSIELLPYLNIVSPKSGSNMNIYGSLLKTNLFAGMNVNDKLSFRGGFAYTTDLIPMKINKLDIKLDRENTFDISLSTSYKASDKLKLNFDIDKSLSGHIKKDLSLNFVARYSL